MSDLYLIVKRGLYYRPNSCGYTGIKDEAGRYSLAEVAERFPNTDSANQDGITFVAEADAPDYSEACYWDTKLKHQHDKAQAEITRLTSALAYGSFYKESDIDALQDKITSLISAFAASEEAIAEIAAKDALIRELVSVIKTGRDYVSDAAEGLTWSESNVTVNGEVVLRKFIPLAQGDLPRFDAALTRAKEMGYE